MCRKITRNQEYIRDLLILAFIVLGIFLYIKIKAWISNPSEGTLTSSGEVRSYQLYVPDSYNRRTPTPLVITLHGYTSKPSDIAFTSRWNDLADQQGFLVVYPQGYSSPSYWHTSTSPYGGRSVSKEVQFFSDLIDKLEDKYNIDPSRIYVNGISMGGGMSHVLACKLADRVAAVGSVAGAYAFPADQCKPSRPMPMMIFHGTGDDIIPYEGGYFSSHYATYPAIPQFAEEWSKKNQCVSVTDTPQEGEVSSVSYTQCAQNADVVLYTVYGGGHTWPGDPSGTTSSFGLTTQQIDATQLMWQFFQQHPLP